MRERERDCIRTVYYTILWYMYIKTCHTTLLVNSKLQFPVNDNHWQTSQANDVHVHVLIFICYYHHYYHYYYYYYYYYLHAFIIIDYTDLNSLSWQRKRMKHNSNSLREEWRERKERERGGREREGGRGRKENEKQMLYHKVYLSGEIKSLFLIIVNDLKSA